MLVGTSHGGVGDVHDHIQHPLECVGDRGQIEPGFAPEAPELLGLLAKLC